MNKKPHIAENKMHTIFFKIVVLKESKLILLIFRMHCAEAMATPG